LYLLDKQADEIWKYLASTDGYGKKDSYFKPGQAVDFFLINSFSIDGSVYLAGDSLVFKYTSGLRDDFKVDLPEKQPSFNKVFTSKNLEKVYLWDKNKGKVYVIGKTGQYQEQIVSEIFKKGKDLVVYKNDIYALEGKKIFLVK